MTPVDSILASLPDPGSVQWDDWLRLALEAATLVFLIIYVAKTWQMASATRDAVTEAKDARLEALAPRVLVYFDLANPPIVEVIVQNAGAGTATEVTFELAPAFPPDLDDDPGSFFRTPKAAIPPGVTMRHFIGTTPALLRDGCPDQYEVKVSFVGAENCRKYSYRQVLDLAGQKGRVGIRRRSIDDIAQLLEKGQRDTKSQFDRLIRLAEITQARASYAGSPELDLRLAVRSLGVRWRVLTSRARAMRSAVWWLPLVEELRVDAVKLMTGAYAQPNGEPLRDDAQRLVDLFFERAAPGDREWEEKVTACVDSLVWLVEPSVRPS